MPKAFPWRPGCRRSPGRHRANWARRAAPWGLTLPFLLLATPAAALELDGVFRQGGLVTGRTVPGAEVHLSGRPLPVTPDGVFLMGFGRDAPTNQKLVVEPPGGPARSYPLRIRERDYGVQRIDGLPQAMVHPDPAALARIREEQTRVERARGHLTRISGFREEFSWPVTGRVSGVYGTRRILNGEPRQPHFGVDIVAPSGTPVRSPASGVVRLAEPDLYFSGGTVILDHGWTLTSTFLHLESLRVAEGEAVSRGQVIGQVGATGRATGPHLDWRINLGEKRLDPALLAGPMPGGKSGP